MTTIHGIAIQPYLDKIGIDSLKPKQTRIIQRLLENRDIIGILPTGYGKSMTYIMMQLITKKTVIVISPLISLMKDQRDKLDHYGIRNVCFNSSNSELYSSDPNKKGEIESVKKSDFQGILYFSPESFMKYEYLIKFLIKQDRISMITIDECHCITTWCDFRKSYSDLVNIRKWIGKRKIPILALSATATKYTIQEISNQLELRKPVLVKTSFHKPQLSVSIIEKSGFHVDTYKISTWVKSSGSKTIVYCKTKADTEKMAKLLKEMGHAAEYYHAGISSDRRETIQDQFSKGHIQIMTATIAFGMGVDISDIYMIIHYGLSKDIESYYQEIGRAGRDHREAKCIAMWSKKDFVTNRYFVNNIEDEELRKKQLIRTIIMEKMVTSDECRMKYMCEYFGETIEKCGKCDNCTTERKQKQMTTMGIYSQYIVTKTFLEIGHGCGITTICNILLNTLNASQRSKFKSIRTIGALRRYSPRQLNTMMRTLVHDGYLEENTGANKFATFYILTPESLQFYKKFAPKIKSAMNVLRAFVKKHRVKEVFATKKIIQNNRIPSMFVLKPNDMEYKKRLMEWRLEKSKSVQLPPYCIVSNKSIDEIIHVRPKNMEELIDVYGMGSKRCKRYGQDILNIIN